MVGDKMFMFTVVYFNSRLLASTYTQHISTTYVACTNNTSYTGCIILHYQYIIIIH